MILANTGEFKLDGRDLVIHPDLKLAQFRQGDIPFRECQQSPDSGYAVCHFSGLMDGMREDWTIRFRGTDLHGLDWRPVETPEEPGRNSDKHNPRQPAFEGRI